MKLHFTRHSLGILASNIIQLHNTDIDVAGVPFHLAINR